MAALSDFLPAGMNEQWLKPRMLRSLIKDALPDNNRPMPSSSDLSSLLNHIKTHGLLSERLAAPSDPKLAEAWRQAVDSWVDRVLALVSSNMPDKSWAGICFLGVTCEDCSSDRFIKSYSLWFQKLLSSVQPPSSSSFVKVASCASLSDMFTRLSDFSNLKKDAISFAGKVIQPILQLLNEDGSEAVKEAAADLLCTLLMTFPSSLSRHYDNVESVLVSKILSSKCSSEIVKKFAHCLSLLPKVRGDEDTWSLLMHKILMEIDYLLGDAFQGLEDASSSSNFRRLLNPPGKEPPVFGVQSRLLESSVLTTKRLGQLVVPTISTLVHCCCAMLNNSYLVQVTIPVRTLIALVERVLRVSGSLPDSRKPSTTALHQELLCYELPIVHLDILDLLIAVVKGVRSQLLPHAANVARIVTDYFRRATFPSIRTKLYSLAHTLLISMGVGAALYLSQEVINSAFTDLSCSENIPSLHNKFSSGVAGQTIVSCSPRKRKFGSEATSQHQNGHDNNYEQFSSKLSNPLSLKIAALKALEALLMVGGSLRSDSWRSNVDFLLITVATNACEAAWSYDGTLKEELSSSRQDFQLAALQALLASLLSPSHVRPPHLSEGLELFRRGKLETGTELAAFCAHALLALEALIHPRALPINDFTGSRGSAFDEGFKRYSSQNLNMSSLEVFSNMNDEEKYCDWFNTIEEEQPANNLDDTVIAGKDRVDRTEAHATLDGRAQESVKNADVEMTCGDVEVHELHKTDEPEKTGMTGAYVTSPSKQDVTARSTSSSAELAGNDRFVETPKISGVANADNAPKALGGANGGDLSKLSGFANKGKDVELSHDSDADSLDSLPDIVLSDSD